jgi:hypothetical protein
MGVDSAGAMAKSSRRSQTDSDPTQQQSESAASPAYSSSATGGYDRDRVASRAYELYMARGGGDGNDMEDWFAAEREVSSNGDRREGADE